LDFAVSQSGSSVAQVDQDGGAVTTASTSRSRSLAAQWRRSTNAAAGAAQLLPNKPTWINSLLDKTRQTAQHNDLDKQHQVGRPSHTKHALSLGRRYTSHMIASSCRRRGTLAYAVCSYQPSFVVVLSLCLSVRWKRAYTLEK